jgi:ribosomal protein S12
MERIETEVVHSQSKTAWNVIGKIPGMKYKIARVPYDIAEGMEKTNTRNKAEALKHAEFISYCFNNADRIK